MAKLLATKGNAPSPKGGKNSDGAFGVGAAISELPERIRVCATKVGSGDELARMTGIPRRTLENYLSGNSEPKAHAVGAIAAAAGVSTDWLLMGVHGPVHEEPPSHMVAIPIMETAASAGPGNEAMTEHVTDFLWFNDTWLRQTYGVNPNDLKLLPSTGDSMSPTIAAGAMLMVNTGKIARMPGDGIYVVRLEGDILVKRLQRMPGGTIKVSSDNPAYEPFSIRLDDAAVDFALLGRVVVAVDFKKL